MGGMATDNPAFRNKIASAEKLRAFGFVSEGEDYVYSETVVDGQFNLVVRVAADKTASAKVYDADTGDEYVLHLSPQAAGAFVGRVRAECDGVLQKIADNCFETKIFKTEDADSIIRYIREKYQEEFEFLWEKFPNNAIVRRKDTQKWYAALLTAAKDKIGAGGEGTAEIIDLRMKTEDIERFVDDKKYFGGYHMNKKHWITICLDGSVTTEEICRLVDESRLLAKK